MILLDGMKHGSIAIFRYLHQLEATLEQSEYSSQTSKTTKQTNLMVQIKILQDYIAVLKRKLKRREMQLTSARQLYGALQTSQGPFIEKHKLSAIVKKFQEYQVQVQRQFKQDISSKRQSNYRATSDESEKVQGEL